MHTDVCVIGNGTIGKALALGLAQAGRNVTLLCPEKLSESGADAPSLTVAVAPAWDLRVYAVNTAARKLLQTLKVWDALDAARIAPVDAMTVYGDGAQAGKIGFDAYGAHADALAWIVEDRNLNQALDAALRFTPNLTLRQGAAARVDVTAQQTQVRLADGTTVSAALLVGADGAHSWVRHQADIGIDYRPYDQRAVVSNFDCSVAHQGIAYQWFTAEEGIVALLPLPGQRVSLVWSAPTALAQKLLDEGAAGIAQRLNALPGFTLGALTAMQPERVQAIDLALIRAHQFTAPRLALVGDAAHVIHPLAGHGMNLGFADVAALLDILAQPDATRDCGDARLLARYARARKEDVLLMQLATDGLARIFSSNFEPLRVARNLGLNLLDKLPLLKRRMMAHAAGT